jgi:hypothetical protein
VASEVIRCGLVSFELQSEPCVRGDHMSGFWKGVYEQVRWSGKIPLPRSSLEKGTY